MELRELTATQLDALRELCNIGAGNAATALCKLVGAERVNIDVPRVEVAPFSKVPELLGGAETPCVAVMLRMEGQASGLLMLAWEEKAAFELAARLLGKRPDQVTKFDMLARSALCEVGNIVASSFLNALGALLNTKLLPSIPALLHDMSGAVVDTLLAEQAMHGNEALLIETILEEPRAGSIAPYIGRLFIFPELGSLASLFAALRV